VEISTEFRDERVPSRTTKLLIDKKQKHKRRVLTEEKLDEIGARIEHTPRSSWKRLAQETVVSKSGARTATRLLKPSSESWCLVCCKCKKDCFTCVFLMKQLIVKNSDCREDVIFNISCDLCIVTTSFQMLWPLRHADSSAKFSCASQQVAHRLP
jgi:hypothetical protein